MGWIADAGKLFKPLTIAVAGPLFSLLQTTTEARGSGLGGGEVPACGSAFTPLACSCWYRQSLLRTGSLSCQQELFLPSFAKQAAKSVHASEKESCDLIILGALEPWASMEAQRLVVRDTAKGDTYLEHGVQAQDGLSQQMH